MKFIDDEVFETSLSKVRKHIENNGFEGYDPYDGLNTKLLPFLTLNNKWLKISLIQFIKLFPINIRPILMIEKGINLKGIGLIAMGYLNLYEVYEDEYFLRKAEECLNILRTRSLIDKYNYYCWNGSYFQIVFPNSVDYQTTPSIICTVTCAIPFIQHYQLTGNGNSIKIARSSIDFLKKELLVRNEKGIFFKYDPTDDETKIVYNASTHGVQLLAHYNNAFYNKENIKISTEIINYIIKKQNPDGSWYYSESNGSIRKQIDFHQGFILDGISAYYYELDHHRPDVYLALKKGADFYFKEQFIKDGRSKWRYPRKWPVDTHNQAQGIITFSRLQDLDDRYLPFSKKIAMWMINNMQNKKGYFYYQKWPIFKSKIDYMRWSQAWMFYALTELLKNDQKRD